MKNPNNQISVTEFKKHFLTLVNDVKTKNKSFIITKRKLPIAQVTPLSTKKEKKSYFGCGQGLIKINDDIVNYSSESDWEINE